MPRFTDYLFAPWKIFGLIALSVGGHSAATQISATADGAMCGIKDVGGQLISVCHVGGYEMPSFVFWASLTIFGIFAATSIALMFQCSRVGVMLTLLTWKINKALPAASKSGAPALSSAQLVTLRELMNREPVVAHAWRQFDETLIVPTAGSPNDEILATQSIDQALARSALVEEHVSTALFGSIPGILTGLGLLMTFVAILDGLSHVTVAANMDVKGIGGLINGLSGKFVSSIVAVTCAVSFVLVERLAYSRPYQAHRKLMGALAGRFRRQTTEHLLHSIQKQLSQQAIVQNELSRALLHLQGGTPRAGASAAAGSSSSGSGPASAPVAGGRGA